MMHHAVSSSGREVLVVEIPITIAMKVPVTKRSIASKSGSDLWATAETEADALVKFEAAVTSPDTSGPGVVEL
jgi:hypothetical protein